MSKDASGERRGPLAPIDPEPISVYPMPPFGTPDLRWEPLHSGVEVAWLYRSNTAQPARRAVALSAGATIPEHEHLDYEHIFLLQGSQSDGDRHYTAGTLTVFPPGLSHNIVSEERLCRHRHLERRHSVCRTAGLTALQAPWFER